MSKSDDAAQPPSRFRRIARKIWWLHSLGALGGRRGRRPEQDITGGGVAANNASGRGEHLYNIER